MQLDMFAPPPTQAPAPRRLPPNGWDGLIGTTYNIRGVPLMLVERDTSERIEVYVLDGPHGRVRLSRSEFLSKTSYKRTLSGPPGSSYQVPCLGCRLPVDMPGCTILCGRCTV